MYFFVIFAVFTVAYKSDNDNSNCIFHDVNRTLDLSLFINSSIVLEYKEAANSHYVYSPCRNMANCTGNYHKGNAMIVNSGFVGDYNFCDILAVWNGGIVKAYWHSELQFWQFTSGLPETNGVIAVQWHCNQTIDLHQTYITSTTFSNGFDFVAFSMDIASKYACQNNS
eukprot:516453_1